MIVLLLRDNSPPSVHFRGKAGFGVRGNSSRAHPKLPYRLEFINGEGKDRKVSILGMPAESDWILFPAFTDKTLMRDMLAYELWAQMGHYAPRTRYVELYLKDCVSPDANAPSATARDTASAITEAVSHRPFFESVDRARNRIDGRSGQRSPPREDGYEGVYVLIEKIKRGKHRVAIRKSEPDPADARWYQGGFIFKKDRPNPGEQGFITGMVGVQFAFEEPKERDLTIEQKNWLRTHLTEFEQVLFSDRFDDPVVGYARYIEVDSFIDYHWMVEVSKNIDGYWFSQFLHLDRGDRIRMGPIWDYDLAFGNVFYQDGYKTDGWRWEKIRGPSYRWYNRLFDDPDFVQRYIDRWAELRANVFATSNILARIDRLAGELKHAQRRNYERWPTLGTYVHPNRFIGKTYEEEVAWLKHWVRDRLAWIDSQGFPAPEIVGSIANAPSGDIELTITGPGGRVFHTLDGSDPRVRGGQVSPKALEYLGPVRIPATNGITVVARTRSDFALWSPPMRWSGSASNPSVPTGN